MTKGSMKAHDSDKYWQFIGNENPYWGVITHDKFDKDRLTAQSIEDFYASGDSHVELVLQTIHRYIDDGFVTGSALDFGCGVGRIVAPLAERFASVTGVDVSEGMLKRARARCEARNLSNVTLLKGDDQLSGISGAFDLVHSFIVLQHIPPNRGYDIADRLLHVLKDGGIGVLHFVYFKEVRSKHPKLRAIAEKLKLYSTLSAVRSLFRPQSTSTSTSTQGSPDGLEMEMNPYNLNVIFQKLQTAGVRRLHVEHTDHGGFWGLVLFFKKSRRETYSM